MAEVTLKNIAKIYPGNVKAVKNIDLEIRDREFMVLVGPSGCGKSTTLRMIAGLEEISEGTVHIGNREVNDVPPKDRDIAMVFQNYALYPHMTVYDNMAFGLKLRKFKKSEIKKRVEEAARILSIEEYLDRRPKALSGGQRQRVAVGRAIVRKPEAFLFDEPLSNLDAKMRVQMRTEISKLHTQLETTMIYVTHDQVEAMTMGDRICVMKDGLIQQVDNPLNLYDNPANLFVAGFIGTPPMNFFHGVLVSKSDGLYFKEETFELKMLKEWEERLTPYADKKIVFGIRPEDICWSKTEDGDYPSIEAEVEVMEPMGCETYLYMNTGAHSFIARVEAHNKFHVGDKVQLPLFMPKVHIFDSASEDVIV
ncbi:MAG: sn-glycerol-3-phosphate ABC transporter ATP-binding protein UgpC [Lentisphaerae bacterium]|nr:sn-glycerol-3-phosphate ABC transporter ATP-binding protein UgpC [Lentisphaerota bacterium]MCP4100293.1 sn-glycerol-3-phosphate ABC transporter ATP-binding protein UgpC [Lentisphaerota bacterium]